MKIINDLGIKRYDNSPVKTSKTGTKTYSGSFDEITIRAGSEEVRDKAFAKQCADKLKADIRKPKGEELIQELKQKIANDEYRVDYDRLIKKLTLEG